MDRPACSRGLALRMTDTVWVTGGSGLVGGSLQRSLGEHQPDLRVVAPSSAELDLRDAAAVTAFAAAARPVAVIHAAGRVGGIAANIKHPFGFLHDNMLMGMNVIRASVEAGVPKLINIGSSCMYPKDHQGLLTEEDVLAGPLEPTNEGYALAKISADRLCEYVARESGLAYRTVIPSNLYGPGDHFDEFRGHLVASAMRKVHRAKANGAPVEIWGDGTARREFTYVTDVTDWIAAVATDPSRFLSGSTWEWGSTTRCASTTKRSRNARATRASSCSMLLARQV